MSDNDWGAVIVIGIVWGIPILVLGVVAIIRTIKE